MDSKDGFEAHLFKIAVGEKKPEQTNPHWNFDNSYTKNRTSYPGILSYFL